MNEVERAIKNRILYHCDERQHFYKLRGVDRTSITGEIAMH